MTDPNKYCMPCGLWPILCPSQRIMRTNAGDRPCKAPLTVHPRSAFKHQQTPTEAASRSRSESTFQKSPWNHRVVLHEQPPGHLSIMISYQDPRLRIATICEIRPSIFWAAAARRNCMKHYAGMLECWNNIISRLQANGREIQFIWQLSKEVSTIF